MNKASAKNLFWWLLNLSLVAIIILGFSLIGYVRSEKASQPPARTITVSAEGKSIAIPDIATLNFSVVSEGSNPASMQEENTEKMNSVLAFVKGKGIKDEDIKTTSYNLSPQYNHDKFTGERFIYSYVLTQSVTIKMRNFDDIGNIVGELPKLGINQIGTVRFEVDDPDIYLTEAREEAFEKAREKANVMARQNSVKIANVVTFSEGGGYHPIVYRKTYGADFSLADGGTAPAPQLKPGSEEIIVNVNVTYEIR